jgi:hypothetical protein
MLVKDLIQHLASHHDPDETVAYDVWCYEDVMTQADGRGMSVTKEEAMGILEEMDHRKDANMGITWDTIDFYLDEME